MSAHSGLVLYQSCVCTCTMYDCFIMPSLFRPSQENTRNTTIKDTMRDNCVPQMVESWLQIMVNLSLYNLSLRTL